MLETPEASYHYELINNRSSTESDMSHSVNFENENNFVGVESDSEDSTQQTVVISAGPEQSRNMKQNHVGINKIFENVTSIVHFTIFVFVAFILYLSFAEEVELFTWHPILLSVGWILLMTEAILAISNNNIFTWNISPRNRTKIHWLLQVCATVCISIGFIIAVVNKNIKNKQHFKTWHAIFGLVSFISLGITCSLGALTLYRFSLRQYIGPLLNKIIHIFSGVTTFVFGAVTVILSLYSNWFTKRTSSVSQVLCLILVLVTSLWVLLSPLRFLKNKLQHR